MARDASDATPIESHAQLVETLSSGCKPKSAWRVGTEHEKFGFYYADFSPVPYEGERGIRQLLETMEGLLGWTPIMDGEHIIGLTDPTGQGAISLEPGGQFELSGAPLATIHQTCREVNAHLAQVRECATPLGIGFLGLGFSPKWTRAETPVMPKSRYAIMARYMPKVGGHGPRHDVPHLHHPGEPRFLRRGRHGAEDARRPRASADRDRAFRQFAIHSKASRTASCPIALRSGSTPTPTAPACCPSPSRKASGSSATSIGRSTCRCISSSAATRYHDVAGASFRDLLDGKLSRCPASAPPIRTGRTTFRRCSPRSASRTTSRCAAPMAARPPHLRAARRSGSVSSTIRVSLDAAWQLVKRLDQRASARRSARPSRCTALDTPFRNRTVREIATRGGRACRARASPGAAISTATEWTKRFTFRRSKRSLPPAGRRPTGCSKNTSWSGRETSTGFSRRRVLVRSGCSPACHPPNVILAE